MISSLWEPHFVAQKRVKDILLYTKYHWIVITFGFITEREQRELNRFAGYYTLKQSKFLFSFKPITRWQNFTLVHIETNYGQHFKVHLKWKIRTMYDRKHREKRRNCVTSNFSFSHNVFHSYISLVLQNAVLCGNGLINKVRAFIRIKMRFSRNMFV